MPDSRLPFLIFTDAPDGFTGLSRICRDLASLMHSDPQLKEIFRVGTLGVFGQTSSQFPWFQYTATSPDDAMFRLPRVTEDFFQGQKGIVFSIMPPSWLFDLLLPQFRVQKDEPWSRVQQWVESGAAYLWAYLAIESHGPLNRFPLITRRIIEKLDRSLYYNRWGAELAANSQLPEPYYYLHHGIDTNVWSPAPADKVAHQRETLGLSEDDLLIGCVATNTRRKQIALLIEAFYLIRYQIGGRKAKLWLHTDRHVADCNIPGLLEDFSLRDPEDVLTTCSQARWPDARLALMYSACDVTTLPTGGEGFGYPVIESLSCGTPCVTSTFGGQSEFYGGPDNFHQGWLVPPASTRIFGAHNLLEPIHDPQVWATRLMAAWTEARHRKQDLANECRSHAMIWDWNNQWPYWKDWLVRGHPAVVAQSTPPPTAIEEESTDAPTPEPALHEPPTGSPGPSGPSGGDPDDRPRPRLVSSSG